ncbi:MAG: OmpA family protein [Desulfomicrobium apsheronum]|nr:OmpA family protein [Desulfomicrobium apsheronum]
MRTLILLLLIALAGCAAKNTTIVLIEDPDGSVGSVTVKTPAGEQTLSSARQSTAVQASEAPTPVRVVDQAEIDRTYGDALKILPLPVETFILYFESGTSDLTTESLPLTEKVLVSITHRQSTDVRVYGHSDRVGTSEINYRLSMERAEAMRMILENLGVAKDIIQVSSHGEGNPLVPTEDEVSEPRNRRVEVLVR